MNMATEFCNELTCLLVIGILAILVKASVYCVSRNVALKLFNNNIEQNCKYLQNILHAWTLIKMLKLNLSQTSSIKIGFYKHLF